ncbi:hypothetical protein [Gordonia hankookensis]|uniref:Uncharacterized protein n=1 Tax=Gordonia hankookensis TaxID=589403 RepID=A0ABR7WHZ1_9ACTN|nr:hypothetical protein [Gordonia hankookensis]MBD1322123.1 hypothetical protein [Gordonia hankookensis]
MHVPVTLASWMIGDGAAAFPAHGDPVDIVLGLVPAQDNDLPAMCITATAEVEQLGGGGAATPDAALVHFSAFAAVAHNATSLHHGESTVHGRLHVEYEMTAVRVPRVRGTVLRRRLITEVRSPGEHWRPPTYELSDIITRRTEFEDSAMTAIGEVDSGQRGPRPHDTWRHDTGLLLDIEID